MKPIESAVVHRLKRLACALVTVESCTGGLVAHRITQVPGSSAIFWGSLVTYDNSAKEALAGVPRELLIRHGAVSAQVAQALAEGGLAVMQRALDSAPRAADSGVGQVALRACVATTGIAGPSGGTPQKPVGLCYVGVAVSGLPTLVREVRIPAGKTREEYKNEFAEHALEELVRHLPGDDT